MSLSYPHCQHTGLRVVLVGPAAQDLRPALENHGARVMALPRDGSEIVIDGRFEPEKIRVARKHQVPVIDEAELRRWIASGAAAGKRISVTGKVGEWSRDELSTELAREGAALVGSAGPRCDALVDARREPRALARGIELGCGIISADEARDAFASCPPARATSSA